MEKTINIGDKEVRLTNNVGWMMTYRDQFGTDIVMSLTPLIASGLDIVSGLVDEATDGDIFDTKKLLAALDGDTLIDALAHLSGFEMVDLVKITWAMAKEADDSIPDPKRWVKDFDSFPLDEVAPEVAKLAVSGLVSSKNLKRLKALAEKMRNLQP
jgi:hypothetical protein